MSEIQLDKWNRGLVSQVIELLESETTLTNEAISQLRSFLNVNPGGPVVGPVSATESDFFAITERSFLQNLRDTAQGMCVANLNENWVRAYHALADAADWLDSMQARCEIPMGPKLDNSRNR